MPAEDEADRSGPLSEGSPIPPYKSDGSEDQLDWTWQQGRRDIEINLEAQSISMPIS